jgi:hypothetical protein
MYVEPSVYLWDENNLMVSWYVSFFHMFSNSVCKHFIESFRVRRVWDDIFQAIKEKNYNSPLVCLAKLFFKIEGEIKTLYNKQKLEEFVTTKPVLQKYLKDSYT